MSFSRETWSTMCCSEPGHRVLPRYKGRRSNSHLSRGRRLLWESVTRARWPLMLADCFLLFTVLRQSRSLLNTGIGSSNYRCEIADETDSPLSSMEFPVRLPAKRKGMPPALFPDYL